MKHALLLCALTMVASSICLPASAQYKWRNPAGVIQFSDMPPPLGTPEKDVLQRPATASRPTSTAAVNSSSTPSATAAVAASGVMVNSAPLKNGEPELEAKRRKVEQEQAAKAKADAEKTAAARAENCSRAQTNLRTLEAGTRITQTNAKGEREVMDDKARADSIRLNKDSMATDCK